MVYIEISRLNLLGRSDFALGEGACSWGDCGNVVLEQPVCWHLGVGLDSTGSVV